MEMYDPDNTPLSTGGIQDLLELVTKLQLSLKKLDALYEKEHVKCLMHEVEIYTLRERVKKLEHQMYLDGWVKSPDGMGR